MPAELQNAVAQLLDNGKDKQVWLKRSLGTKAVQEANVRAKPVQMQFDRLIAQARASLAARPMRSSLSAAEIQRMTEYTYAQMLAGQDKFVREAPAIEAEYRAFEDQPQQWIDAVPVFGLSAGQMLDAHVSMPELISEAETALARGDIGYYAARAKIEDALEVFQIALDAKCDDYRRLGVEVLRAYVRGLRDVAARYNGEPIPTPQLVLPARMAESGGTLWDALEGWRKEKSPSKGVFDEYERGVRLFTELHGNIAVAQINRTHARVFREALQELPKHRRADLRTAPILQLTEWSRKNPDAKRIANTTASKLLGGVQTVARWAFKNGIVPDDVRWSDPFAEMRLEREVPEREAFTTPELNMLFRSPLEGRSCVLATDARTVHWGKAWGVGRAARWRHF